MLIPPTVGKVARLQTLRVEIDPLEGWGDRPPPNLTQHQTAPVAASGFGDKWNRQRRRWKEWSRRWSRSQRRRQLQHRLSSSHGVASVPQLAPSARVPNIPTKPVRSVFHGLVELNVVVQVDGRPGKIELVSGPGLGLDEKAIEAVRNWRFNPAIGPNGKAVAVVIPIEVQFQLF